MKTSDYWKECKEYYDAYYRVLKINKTYYRIGVSIMFEKNSNDVFVEVSSGTKRKHLKSFIENDFKRDGGLKALATIKKIILNLNKTILKDKLGEKDLEKDTYIWIAWSDNRRRNVYDRLTKEGFYYTHYPKENKKMLCKKVEL